MLANSRDCTAQNHTQYEHSPQPATCVDGDRASLLLKAMKNPQCDHLHVRVSNHRKLALPNTIGSLISMKTITADDSVKGYEMRVLRKRGDLREVVEVDKVLDAGIVSATALPRRE